MFPLKNFFLTLVLVESLKWKYKTLKKNAIFQVSFYISKVKVDVFSKKSRKSSRKYFKMKKLSAPCPCNSGSYQGKAEA